MYFLQVPQKRFLDSLNPLVSVMLIYAVILVRTSAAPTLPRLFLHADVLLPFIVYFGQRRTMAEGVALTIITAHLYSLCSSAPIGIFVLIYLAIFMAARGLSYVVFANDWRTVLILIGAMTLVYRILGVLFALFFDHSWSYGWFTDTLAAVLSTAFIGYLLYRLMALTDYVTSKTPRVRIELGEGEL